MRTYFKNLMTVAIVAVASFTFAGQSANAALLGQLGILDLNANGGINPATGAAWAAGDTYRFIFATSQGTFATSSDIATYNAFVDNAANAGGAMAGLGGTTWSALASTPTVNAIDNTGLTGAKAESFFLLDNTKIADNYADFWDGHTGAERIDVSETGGSPLDSGGWQSLWTGSDGNGNTVANRGLGDASGTSRGGLWGGAASAAQWINRFDLPQTMNPVPNNFQQSAATNGLALYGVSDVLTVRDPDAGGGGGIPEPATVTLAMLGLGGLMMRRRRNA